MHPDTPVTLPTITAQQRQTLIALLHKAHRDTSHVRERADIVALAHALDLHNDAVPVEPVSAYGTSEVCPVCGQPDNCGDCDHTPVGNAAPGPYYIQPMTGTVHTDPACSTGTARYGTVPSSVPATEVEALIAAGRSKACRTCMG